MDEYYKLAAAYFKEFEPRSSFPKLNSCHWYLWALSLAIFGYFGHEYFFGPGPSSEKPFWPFFASEIAFLLSCMLIAVERFRSTVRANNADSGLKLIDRLGIAKRARLEALLGKPAWHFMATAKEIIELRGLEKACRSAVDKGFGELLPKIYDPDSKARLLTLITALLGLVMAVLGKNEAINIIEVLSDKGTWAFIKALAQLAISIFFTVIAVFYVLRQTLELLLSLFSSLFPELQNRQITLDYFVRDLIQYHRMEPPATPPAAPAPAETLPLPREPGPGTLIAAICLALLQRPPMPSNNAAPLPTKSH